MSHIGPNLLNAFLLSILFIVALDKAARLAGLVDEPAGRKTHDGAVPLTGGLAIFGAFLVSVTVLGWPSGVTLYFVIGLLIVVIVGTIDDFFDLGAKSKLAAQILSAVVMLVPAGLVIREIPAPIGEGVWALGALSLPLTLFFFVGIINAFNMFDGLDGLGGGAAVIAFFWLGVASMGTGTGTSIALLMLISATVGFLVFNMRHPWRRRASVFMGDAGSMMLGACVAYYVIDLSSTPAEPVSFVALLWVCAVPAIDTLSLMVRRKLAGRSPMSCDREHLHHLLMEMGLSPSQTTGLILASCFLLGGIGVLGARSMVPAPVMFSGLIMLVVVHTLVVVGRDRRRMGRTVSVRDANGISGGTTLRKPGT